MAPQESPTPPSRFDLRRVAFWSAAVALTIATFTPLVIPPGRAGPRLFGMPYALWVGLVVAGLFVGLTAAATRLHGGDEPPDKEGGR